MLSIAEIKPYLDMLDDPYTQYYSPEQAKQLLSLLQNQISGIGVVLSAVPEQAPQIVQIIEQ